MSRRTRVLGTPLEHLECVYAQLRTAESQQAPLDRTTPISDLQAACLLPRYFSLTRARHTLRTTHSELVRAFAEQHDAGLQKCVSGLLETGPHTGRVGQIACKWSKDAPCSRRPDCLLLVNAESKPPQASGDLQHLSGDMLLIESALNDRPSNLSSQHLALGGSTWQQCQWTTTS